ncbi:Poly(A)-specific ribonuclease [Aphelenchoides fujianensis]|nr:Poly(A)-specific ribonuclease [Aphelenchoides fujianensis]
MIGGQDVALHDVWANNLEEEFENLRILATKATHVIAAIEFPGVCMTPLGTFFSREQYSYQQLLVNVNALKPIQFGFTFVHDSRTHGQSQMSVFQFNLHFDREEDMFTDEAIQVYEAANFNFRRHSTEGIKLLDFGDLFTTSGLIASKLVWVSFHSAFDFGFLTRSLCGGSLPPDVRHFYRMFRKYFKVAYDVKQILQHPQLARANLKPEMTLQEASSRPCSSFVDGGLQVATALNVPRWGLPHQAASDSILTARIFFQLKAELNANWAEVKTIFPLPEKPKQPCPMTGHAVYLSHTKSAA